MSRTYRRKKGSLNFYVPQSYKNPFVSLYHSKEVKIEDGEYYFKEYNNPVWYSTEEFIEKLTTDYYERWGKNEHRDKKNRFYTRIVKHFAHKASRCTRRKICYDLIKDPEADYIHITAYERGIVWCFD